jgi:hypothetical protein
LLFGGTQTTEPFHWIASKPNGLKKFPGSSGHPGVIKPAESVLERMADENVLRDAEVRKEAWMLMHHGDARVLGIERRMK